MRQPGFLLAREYLHQSYANQIPLHIFHNRYFELAPLALLFTSITSQFGANEVFLSSSSGRLAIN